MIFMSDRVVGLDCPHCGCFTETFVLVGQTFKETCEHCGKIIYFDASGEAQKTMSKAVLTRLERDRDRYYDRLRTKGYRRE